MYGIGILMLAVPGLISLRIHWQGRDVRRKDYIYLLWDYLIYSFLLIIIGFFPLFLVNSHGSVHFFNQSFGFVLKYSVVVLIAAVWLPLIWRQKGKIWAWLNKEDDEITMKADLKKNLPETKTDE